MPAPKSRTAHSRLCPLRWLAGFAVPRSIEFIDALLTTDNGKVQKCKLCDCGVTPGTWDHGRHVLRPIETAASGLA